MHRVCFF